MKKIMRIMVMAVVAVVMAAGFNSCSKSDDNSSQTVIPTGTMATSAKLDMNISFSDDILATCDVTAFYIDSDGTKKTETVTSSPFKKEVTYSSLPVKVEYGFNVTPKSNVPEDKELDINTKDNSSIYAVAGTKSKVVMSGYFNEGAEGVPSSELSSIIDQTYKNATFGTTVTSIDLDRELKI